MIHAQGRSSDAPFSALSIADQRCLLVASTGGHLFQLVQLAKAAGVHAESVVLTFDNAQSRRLSSEFETRFVPYVAPRDYRGVLATMPIVWKLLHERNMAAVVSTGAAVALGALPVGVVKRRRSVYVESVSRLNGPSTSGRILARVPGVETYTQHPAWAGDRWRYAGSLLDVIPSPASIQRVPPAGLPKVFVTLGTIHPYRFDRLVHAVAAALPPEADVTWQLGATSDMRGLPGRTYAELDPTTFDELAQAADLVISHGGVATALSLVASGVRPILVPRRSKWNEHVDDHQEQICRDLASRGFALSCEADDVGALISGALQGSSRET